MIFSKKTSAIGIFLMAFIIASCSDTNIDSFPQDNSVQRSLADAATSMNGAETRANLDLSSVGSIHGINETLAARGLNIRLAYAETVTLNQDGSNAIGQTIFANDRTKQLTAQWVPGDTRRGADGNNLTYLVDQTSSTANFGTTEAIDSEPAIDASFETWSSIKKSSKLNIVKVPDPDVEPSFILGGNPFLADISEIGFLPGIFFEVFVGTGSSENVLGVTFTFVFIDENGNATDINGDGFADVALKEVWYNNDFLWKTDPSAAGVDIETVALHENGHALGFGHFGKVSVTAKNNKLHVSPRAVMNAVILGTQRDLLGTDEASFSSIYGNWPK